MEFWTNISYQIVKGMKNITLFIVFMLVTGCNQEKANQFLQSQDIQLVKPRVKATNKIIDSSVVITAELKIDDVKIYFTSNGEEPTEKSEIYTKPIVVNKASVYKLKAYHSQWKKSETEIIKLLKKGKTVDSIIWISSVNQQYSGKGEETLINHTKAGISYLGKEWMGFDTIIKAITIFKEKTFIKSIDIGYLNNPGAWIFPPKKVIIYVSDDGETFALKKELLLAPLKQLVDQKMESIQLIINQKVKAIKIEIENVNEIPDWHDGAGKNAWIFMDEWIFN